MKKALLFFALCWCICVPGKLFGQGEWEWARLGGSGEGYFSATDLSNSVYVAGNHWNTTHFDHDTIKGSGIFISKYDSLGNIKWAVTTDALSSSSGTMGLATDLFGNEYLYGVFDTTFTFEGDTIVNPGAKSFYYYFVAKIDSSGNVKWLKNIGDVCFYYFLDQYNGITTDSNGNIYISCSFSNNPTIGTYSFVNTSSDSSNDMLIVKLDSSGIVKWAKSFGGRQNDWMTGITVTASSKVYISGVFHEDTLTFGDVTLADTSTKPYHWSTFVAKLDSNGNALWAKGSSGTGNCFTYGGIATNSAEDVFIAGDHDGPLTFDAHSLAISPLYTEYGFIAKLNSNGDLSWLKEMQGSIIIPMSVRLDPCGNVWTGGMFGETSCIDTIDGHIILTPEGTNDPALIAGWTKDGGYIQSMALQSGGDDFNSIAIDNCGNIYFESDCDVDTLVLDSDTAIASSVESNLLAKYNPNLSCGDCHNSTLTKNIAILDPISLFPNPTSYQLTVHSDSQITHINIANVLGQAVYDDHQVTKNPTIDVSQLPAGLYMVRINDEVVRKFIKE